MTSLKDEKNQLRKLVRDLKSNLSIDKKKDLSRKVFSKLEKDPLFLSAKTVMAYWSLEDEVHTHDFIEQWTGSKTIILPSVDRDELRLKVYKGITNLAKGQSYKIYEPQGEDFAYPEKIELVIVPGIAFDKEMNRLGRGKAYYDKLLKSLPAKKYGVCFGFQIFDKIPADENDIKMDRVFSE